MHTQTLPCSVLILTCSCAETEVVPSALETRYLTTFSYSLFSVWPYLSSIPGTCLLLLLGGLGVGDWRNIQLSSCRY